MKTLFLIVITAALFGCGNETSDEKLVKPSPKEPVQNIERREDMETFEQEEIKKPVKVNPEFSYLLGTWKGELRNKKLLIVIESIDKNKVTGYNVAGSNKRPITGFIMDDDRDGDGECLGEQISYKLILKEPGNDKWDGIFTIYFADCPEFDENNEQIIDHSFSGYGEWMAFNGKLSGDIFVSK